MDVSIQDRRIPAIFAVPPRVQTKYLVLIIPLRVDIDAEITAPNVVSSDDNNPCHQRYTSCPWWHAIVHILTKGRYIAAAVAITPIPISEYKEHAYAILNKET